MFKFTCCVKNKQWLKQAKTKEQLPLRGETWVAMESLSPPGSNPSNPSNTSNPSNSYAVEWELLDELHSLNHRLSEIITKLIHIKQTEVYEADCNRLHTPISIYQVPLSAMIRERRSSVPPRLGLSDTDSVSSSHSTSSGSVYKVSYV
jgi:hypothetical protein